MTAILLKQNKNSNNINKNIQNIDKKIKKNKKHNNNNNNNKYIQKQLLYNYCYGHSESRILLFPLAPGVNLINHAPSSQKMNNNNNNNNNNNINKRTANVKLEWLSSSSSSSSFNDNYNELIETKLMKYHNQIQQMNPYDILLNYFAPQPQPSSKGHDDDDEPPPPPPTYTGIPAMGGLIMQVIATRNIRVGEELFLDYGTEWENAWQNHITRQKKQQQQEQEQFKRKAIHWNHEFMTKPLPTENDNNHHNHNDYDDYINVLDNDEQLQQLQQQQPWDQDSVILKAFIIPYYHNDNDDGNLLDSDHTVHRILSKKKQRFNTDDDEEEITNYHWLYNIMIANPDYDNNNYNNNNKFYNNHNNNDDDEEEIYNDNEGNDDDDNDDNNNNNNNDPYQIIYDIPHDHFFFVDVPGTSDLYYRDAFRHYISIPNDVWPQNYEWRRRKKK